MFPVRISHLGNTREVLNKRWYNLIVLSFLLSSRHLFSSAQYVSFGKCPRVYGMANFDISRYEGRWYEIEKFFFVFEAASSCVSVEYFDREDGSFAVEIDQVENVGGKREKNQGLTKYVSNDGSASFILDLVISQSPVPFTVRFPYLVLRTDYTTYTLKYRCIQAGAFNAQMLWVLSRNKTMTHEVRDKVHDTLLKLGLDPSRLIVSDQTSCPP